VNCHWKENRRRMYRGFLLFITFLGAVFLSPSVEAMQSEPAQTINKFNATLLESMKKGGELGYEGRYRLLAPVIEDSFALSDTARLAAGRYWSKFSGEERNIYLKTYSEWTIATYAGRFDEYSGEQFKLISESAPERSTVIVISKLIKSDKDEVEFNYLFRQVKGAWRIVDIRISGVSQLALTRTQFVNILEKKGFRELISMLNGKIKDLSKGKGE
jgi:phospholipid transport system substrate-binding protein